MLFSGLVHLLPNHNISFMNFKAHFSLFLRFSIANNCKHKNDSSVLTTKLFECCSDILLEMIKLLFLNFQASGAKEGCTNSEPNFGGQANPGGDRHPVWLENVPGQKTIVGGSAAEAADMGSFRHPGSVALPRGAQKVRPASGRTRTPASDVSHRHPEELASVRRAPEVLEAASSRRRRSSCCPSLPGPKEIFSHEGQRDHHQLPLQGVPGQTKLPQGQGKDHRCSVGRQKVRNFCWN